MHRSSSAAAAGGQDRGDVGAARARHGADGASPQDAEDTARLLRRAAARAPRGARGAVGATVPALITAAVLLPDLVGVDRWLPFAATVAFRPSLAAAVAVLALAAITVRKARRRTWVPGVPVLIVAVIAGAMVVPRTASADPPPPGGVELTLLSFNLQEGQADPGALAAAVRATRPDLVVLTEAGEPSRSRIAPLLPEYRSWTNASPGAPDVRGIVVLAGPEAGAVTPRRLDLDTRYPWAELTGGVLGPTRLVAVHLVSVVPRWIGYWPGELAELRRWCGAGAPTVVVGDFNATGDHSAFRAGSEGCADAATERGASLTATWPADLPRWFGVQIDHVLTRAGPRVREVGILDLPGTDHRALLTRLRL